MGDLLVRLTGQQRWSLAIPVVAVALIYSWVAAAFRPFTWPMYVATAIPIIVCLLAAFRHVPVVRDEPPAPRREVAVWIGLLLLLLAWELFAYFSSPRYDHPTLSTIADNAMSSHIGRAITFALWLTVGWSFFLRSRTSPP
jgi:peptidoglycan/LPS O-acetylase OafA/YrhL